MRAIIQRVERASVEVEGNVLGSIGKGFLVLLGVGKGDTEEDLEYIFNKTIGLRIFEDENEKMNLSIKDIEGELLIISQFTLYGDARKGRRPSFIDSANPEIAESMYEEFILKCRAEGIKTEAGKFGADMNVDLLNQGPVTIMLDSKKTF